MDKLSIRACLSTGSYTCCTNLPKSGSFLVLPNCFTRTCQFLYTDISVISVTFSNSVPDRPTWPTYLRYPPDLLTWPSYQTYPIHLTYPLQLRWGSFTIFTMFSSNTIIAVIIIVIIEWSGGALILFSLRARAYVSLISCHEVISFFVTYCFIFWSFTFKIQFTRAFLDVMFKELKSNSIWFHWRSQL